MLGFTVAPPPPCGGRVGGLRSGLQAVLGCRVQGFGFRVSFCAVLGVVGAGCGATKPKTIPIL